MEARVEELALERRECLFDEVDHWNFSATTIPLRLCFFDSKYIAVDEETEKELRTAIEEFAALADARYSIRGLELTLFHPYAAHQLMKDRATIHRLFVDTTDEDAMLAISLGGLAENTAVWLAGLQDEVDVDDLEVFVHVMLKRCAISSKNHGDLFTFSGVLDDRRKEIVIIVTHKKQKELVAREGSCVAVVAMQEKMEAMIADCLRSTLVPLMYKDKLHHFIARGATAVFAEKWKQRHNEDAPLTSFEQEAMEWTDRHLSEVQQQYPEPSAEQKKDLASEFEQAREAANRAREVSRAEEARKQRQEEQAKKTPEQKKAERLARRIQWESTEGRALLLLDEKTIKQEPLNDYPSEVAGGSGQAVIIPAATVKQEPLEEDTAERALTTAVTAGEEDMQDVPLGWEEDISDEDVDDEQEIMDEDKEAARPDAAANEMLDDPIGWEEDLDFGVYGVDDVDLLSCSPNDLVEPLRIEERTAGRNLDDGRINASEDTEAREDQATSSTSLPPSSSTGLAHNGVQQPISGNGIDNQTDAVEANEDAAATDDQPSTSSTSFPPSDPITILSKQDQRSKEQDDEAITEEIGVERDDADQEIDDEHLEEEEEQAIGAPIEELEDTVGDDGEKEAADPESREPSEEEGEEVRSNEGAEEGMDEHLESDARLLEDKEDEEEEDERVKTDGDECPTTPSRSASLTASGKDFSVLRDHAEDNREEDATVPAMDLLEQVLDYAGMDEIHEVMDDQLKNNAGHLEDLVEKNGDECTSSRSVAAVVATSRSDPVSMEKAVTVVSNNDDVLQCEWKEEEGKESVECTWSGARYKVRKHVAEVHAAAQNATICRWNDCGKNFSNKQSMLYHLITKHALYDCTQCNQCGERFTYVTLRQMHERISHSTLKKTELGKQPPLPLNKAPVLVRDEEHSEAEDTDGQQLRCKWLYERGVKCSWKGQNCDFDAHISSEHCLPGMLPICRWQSGKICLEKFYNFGFIHRHIRLAHCATGFFHIRLAHCATGSYASDAIIYTMPYKCEECGERFASGESYNQHQHRMQHMLMRRAEQLKKLSAERESQTLHNQRWQQTYTGGQIRCEWLDGSNVKCSWKDHVSTVEDHIKIHFSPFMKLECRWKSGSGKMCSKKFNDQGCIPGHIRQEHFKKKAKSTGPRLCGLCGEGFELSEIEKHQLECGLRHGLPPSVVTAYGNLSDHGDEIPEASSFRHESGSDITVNVNGRSGMQERDQDDLEGRPVTLYRSVVGSMAVGDKNSMASDELDDQEEEAADQKIVNPTEAPEENNGANAVMNETMDEGFEADDLLVEDNELGALGGDSSATSSRSDPALMTISGKDQSVMADHAYSKRQQDTAVLAADNLSERPGEDEELLEMQEGEEDEVWNPSQEDIHSWLQDDVERPEGVDQPSSSSSSAVPLLKPFENDSREIEQPVNGVPADAIFTKERVAIEKQSTSLPSANNMPKARLMVVRNVDKVTCGWGIDTRDGISLCTWRGARSRIPQHIWIAHFDSLPQVEYPNQIACRFKNCKETFVAKSNLLHHFCWHHHRYKLPECGVCGGLFLFKRRLATHKRTAHPYLYENRIAAIDDDEQIVCMWELGEAVGSSGCDWRGARCTLEAHVASAHLIDQPIHEKANYRQPIKCGWRDCSVFYKWKKTVLRHVSQRHARCARTQCVECGERFDAATMTLELHMEAAHQSLKKLELSKQQPSQAANNFIDPVHDDAHFSTSSRPESAHNKNDRPCMADDREDEAEEDQESRDDEKTHEEQATLDRAENDVGMVDPAELHENNDEELNMEKHEEEDDQERRDNEATLVEGERAALVRIEDDVGMEDLQSDEEHHMADIEGDEREEDAEDPEMEDSAEMEDNYEEELEVEDHDEEVEELGDPSQEGVHLERLDIESAELLEPPSFSSSAELPLVHMADTEIIDIERHRAADDTANRADPSGALEERVGMQALSSAVPQAGVCSSRMPIVAIRPTGEEKLECEWMLETGFKCAWKGIRSAVAEHVEHQHIPRDLLKGCTCRWEACGQSMNSNLLLTHFRRLHELLFACAICDKRFSTIKSAEQHMERIHKKDLAKQTLEKMKNEEKQKKIEEKKAKDEEKRAKSEAWKARRESVQKVHVAASTPVHTGEATKPKRRRSRKRAHPASQQDNSADTIEIAQATLVQKTSSVASTSVGSGEAEKRKRGRPRKHATNDSQENQASDSIEAALEPPVQQITSVSSTIVLPAVDKKQITCQWLLEDNGKCGWMGKLSMVTAHVKSKHCLLGAVTLCRWDTGDDKPCSGRLVDVGYMPGHVRRKHCEGTNNKGINVKPFSCGTCCERFEFSGMLKQHQLVAHGLRPHPVQPPSADHDYVQLGTAEQSALSTSRALAENDDERDGYWPTRQIRPTFLNVGNSNASFSAIAHRNPIIREMYFEDEQQPGPSGIQNFDLSESTVDRDRRIAVQLGGGKSAQEARMCEIEMERANARQAEKLASRRRIRDETNAEIAAKRMLEHPTSPSTPSVSRSPSAAGSSDVRYSTTPAADDEDADRTLPMTAGEGNSNPSSPISPAAEDDNEEASVSEPQAKRRRVDIRSEESMDMSELEDRNSVNRDATGCCSTAQGSPAGSFEGPSTSSTFTASPATVHPRATASSSVQEDSDDVDEVTILKVNRDRIPKKRGRGRPPKKVIKQEIEDEVDTVPNEERMDEDSEKIWKYWRKDERVKNELKKIIGDKKKFTHTARTITQFDRDSHEYRLMLLGKQKPLSAALMKLEMEKTHMTKLKQQETKTTTEDKYIPSGFPLITPSDYIRLGQKEDACGDFEFLDFSAAQQAKMPNYTFIDANIDDAQDELLNERRDKTKIFESICDCDPKIGCQPKTCACMKQSALEGGRVHMKLGGNVIIVECCPSCSCKRENCPSVVHISNPKVEAVHLGDPMGFGLRINEPAQRGQILLEFTGQATSELRENDDEWSFSVVNGDDTNWHWFTGVKNKLRAFHINPRLYGNAARFISHSKFYNVGWMCIYTNGMRVSDCRAIIFAFDPLEPGDLMYLNYGKAFVLKHFPGACLCMQQLCHGPIADWFTEELTWDQCMRVLERREKWKRVRMFQREQEARGCADRCSGLRERESDVIGRRGRAALTRRPERSLTCCRDETTETVQAD